MTQYYALGVATGTYRGQAFINRQPLPFHPDTANFSEFADRVLLSSIGIFAIERSDHRAKRRAQADHREMLEAAYLAVGLDRAAEHGRIAARLEGKRFDGIWAKSTGEYAALCDARDKEIADLVYTGGQF